MKKTLYIVVVLLCIIVLGIKPIIAEEGLPESIELVLGSRIAVIDGVDFELDTAPQVMDGVTLLPIRFVTEDLLGATVGWDAASKGITIWRGDQVVKLWLNKKLAYLNDQEQFLTKEPVLLNGRTFVPLRFLSESMGLRVDYHAATKKITISRLEKTIVVLPEARFRLVQAEIRAGQQLEVIEESFHPEGIEIVDSLWEVEQNGYKSIVADPRASNINCKVGRYLLSLKVKDELGNWSKPYQQQLIVQPNQPPVITLLGAKKDTIAQGEYIEFTYDYHDEPWDKIVEERWLYRWRDSYGNQREVIGKPEVLFGERIYEIALRLRDSFDNWSEEALTSIRVTDKVVQSEFSYRFSNPVPGDIILNSTASNYNLLPDADWEVSHEGPVLLVSNSPESVLFPGIAYRDQVIDQARVFYYHKNSRLEDSLLKVWLQNEGEEPVEVELRKLVTGGPVSDEMHLGQTVALGYLTSAKTESLTIAPGQTVVINGQQANKVIKTGQLVSGMFDIDVSGAVTVTVAMVDLDYTYQMPLEVLAADGIHQRGTFETGNVIVNVWPDKSRLEKILIGKGIDGDHFLSGVDALTGNAALNRGNYGVIYTINCLSKVNTGVFFNPRGSGFKGAIKGFDGLDYLLPVRGSLNVSALAAVAGVLTGGSEASLLYTTPGGSDSPLVIGFVPDGSW